MENMVKVIILIFTIIYVASPVDGCPGPIDDLILMAMAMGAMKCRLLNKEEDEYIDVE